MPRLLTIDEVAQQLRTSTWTVRRWIRQGKLPGVRIGGEWRIDPIDLAEYIRKGKTVQKESDQNE